jgi:L-ribulose-5-phosphate 3-epimerase
VIVEDMMWTRRDWMRAAGQAAMAAAVTAPAATASATGRRDSEPGAGPLFCLFSKHLPELAWDDVGRVVKENGFDGVDLTVRPKGHVLPERAAEDLPRAVEAIRSHGLAVPMITTDLTSAALPHARLLLEAAAGSGVSYFKTGYWQYRSADVRGEVAAVGRALAGLAALASTCGIELGFHNHAGYVGAALWDIAPAIDRLDPRWAGFYFDPRHAVAEGGGGAWKAATHLVMPRLKMVALKDCVWQKGADGWRIENCPLGEGLVDWPWFGATLRAARFRGPISIHLEYEIPGATPAERIDRTLAAARRDLAFARSVLGM